MRSCSQVITIFQRLGTVYLLFFFSANRSASPPRATRPTIVPVSLGSRSSSSDENHAALPGRQGRQVARSRAPLRLGGQGGGRQAPTPAPVVVKKGGSSFMQRVVSFAVGVSVGAGYGLYALSEDVEQSTQQIQSSVGSLKDEMIAQNAALSKRIEALEKSQ
ncbi:hypothetical protein ON010_g18784 [Phytophthora cinnamomi]|nr:hypothetical protein ON010_g18784 [Phytophthora cinnamomi]